MAVLPDVSGIDRTFAYTVPAQLDKAVAVGSIVRVPLHGRRVRGWVLGEDESRGGELRPIIAVSSLGPDEGTIELCRWAAWRYAGRLRPFLAAASPERAVPALPAPGGRRPPVSRPGYQDDKVAAATDEALGRRAALLRIPPAAPRLDVVLAAHRWAAGGTLLVLVPERSEVALLVRHLSRAGVAAETVPEHWAQAAGGQASIVVGTRRAAFARLVDLAAIVVLDSHSEAFSEQRAPTWDAAVIAQERALRARAACLLVSPCPPVEQATGEIVALAAEDERAGWAHLEIVDRRGDDPRAGLFSSPLGETIRSARRAMPDRPVVGVLNRVGRARLLACGRCRAIVRCEQCGAAMFEQSGVAPEEALACRVCRASRPAVCAACGATRLSRLALGSARAAEEMAALVGEEVAEVSSRAAEPPPGAGILVGTEAVLHRLRRAALVIFLDFDHELLAPRFRAGAQALTLLARASRLVGGRNEPGAGRVIVQTRLPSDEVLTAARDGDPGRFLSAERGRREMLGLPPTSALAELTGAQAKAGADELAGAGIDVAELAGGRFLVRAGGTAALSDALRGAGLPKEGVRVAVDAVQS